MRVLKIMKKIDLLKCLSIITKDGLRTKKLLKKKQCVAIATMVGVKTKENYAARDNLPSHLKKWD